MSLQFHAISPRLDLLSLPAEGHPRPTRAAKRRAISRGLRRPGPSSGTPTLPHPELRAGVVEAVDALESWKADLDSRYDWSDETPEAWRPFQLEVDQLNGLVIAAMDAYGEATGQDEGYVDMLDHDGSRLIRIEGGEITIVPFNANA